ncbi:MAG: holo-ACP synthase [Pseudomonadota bacterium]
MIYGIGTDIVEVARVDELLRQYGERFARKVLSAEEWPEYTTSNQPARFLAKRFAAKEAFAKALGTGLRHPVTLGRIGVAHDDLGKPQFRLDAELQAWTEARRITRRHLSISDEKHLSCAFVVLES